MRADPTIEDGAANAAMERLHVQGSFNHIYCDVDQDDLSGTVKKFYRRFYLRPSYIVKQFSRIKNKNMLRNAVIGGLNVFSFATNKKAS